MAPRSRVKHSTTEPLQSIISGREENDYRNYFIINVHESMGSNSRPLNLQSDVHLSPDTSPTALRGPVKFVSKIKANIICNKHDIVFFIYLVPLKSTVTGCSYATERKRPPFESTDFLICHDNLLRSTDLAMFDF